MPQTPRKKSRAKTWFNGVLREALMDTESEEDTSVTVLVQEQVKGNEGDRIYPREE